MYYTNDGINLYMGDMVQGDREATIEEVSLYEVNILEAMKPKVVTMRQARLALLQSNLLSTIDIAIASGTDEAMKIEWEYATEVRRDWASLITLATALGMTSVDLDGLFELGATL